MRAGFARATLSLAARLADGVQCLYQVLQAIDAAGAFISPSWKNALGFDLLCRCGRNARLRVYGGGQQHFFGFSPSSGVAVAASCGGRRACCCRRCRDRRRVVASVMTLALAARRRRNGRATGMPLVAHRYLWWTSASWQHEASAASVACLPRTDGSLAVKRDTWRISLRHTCYALSNAPRSIYLLPSRFCYHAAFTCAALRCLLPQQRLQRLLFPAAVSYRSLAAFILVPTLLSGYPAFACVLLRTATRHARADGDSLLLLFVTFSCNLNASGTSETSGALLYVLRLLVGILAARFRFQPAMRWARRALFCRLAWIAFSVSRATMVSYLLRQPYAESADAALDPWRAAGRGLRRTRTSRTCCRTAALLRWKAEDARRGGGATTACGQRPYRRMAQHTYLSYSASLTKTLRADVRARRRRAEGRRRRLPTSAISSHISASRGRLLLYRTARTWRYSAHLLSMGIAALESGFLLSPYPR